MNERLAGREFLSGGGELGELTRRHPWEATELGPPETWPASLRLVIRLVLSSRHPMFIWWGPNLIQFYNDAYRRTMGPERHPSALGQPGRECWQEIWPIIGPQIEYVMAGKGATWHEDQLVPVTRHGRRADVWWTYGYSPIDDGTGAVGGVLVVCTDVTQQHVARERLMSLFRQAPGFVAVLQGPEHVFEMANEAYLRLVARTDIIGRPVREALPEVVEQGFVDLLDGVIATGEPYLAEARPIDLVAADGELTRHYLDFVYQPILGDGGRPTGVFVQGHDVTGQVLALQHRDHLTRELEHRVKNMLAMASALVSQTLRGSDVGPELRDVLIGRLGALNEGHQILTRSAWREATVQQVVDGVLGAYATFAGRIAVAGPPVQLTPRQSLSLALALNELLTNASKYGALSGLAGRVEIGWTVEPADGASRLRFTWQESGGPPVTPPQRRGFGSRLIEQVLAADFEGTVRIDYHPAGVRCELTGTLAPPG